MENSQTGVSNSPPKDSQPPASSAAERLRRAATGGGTKPPKRHTATPRTASPTRAIEPGAVHFQLAEGLLRGLQSQVKATTGHDLDVGEFPTPTAVEGDDPERLVKLTAHAIARVADRVTFLRRVSRHLEGTERRAGILSDLAAAAHTLYARNPETVQALAHAFVNDYKKARQERAVKKPPKGSPIPTSPTTPNGHTPGGVIHAS